MIRICDDLNRLRRWRVGLGKKLFSFDRCIIYRYITRLYHPGKLGKLSRDSGGRDGLLRTAAD